MSNYSYPASVKYCSDVSFSFLIFFFFAQVTQASLLAHCKYLEESSCFSSRLNTDDFINHISQLKRCNRHLRIYEPSDAQLAQQQSFLTHFQSLLPELVPANIHQLYKLLIAYLLSWEKDFPVESLFLRDSDHRFLLLNSPRKSVSVTFKIEASPAREEPPDENPSGATACRPSSPKSTAVLLYSLIDPEYPFGFIIRSAGGKITYLICRDATLFPSPSMTQSSFDSTSFFTPEPTPQQDLTPSDLILNMMTQRFADQNIFSDCSPKN